MAFRVRIDSFEGPFDLLLYLVSRQKVDIGAISITEITDQYLEEVSHMQLVDLDVASDFLLVASTLLEIKAASLVPADKDATVEEYEELPPNEARDLLVQRLLTYKQFKNAAASLSRRGESESRLHERTCGPDMSLLTLIPDYLVGVTLEDIAFICATALGRRDPFLLDSDHIAAKPIPVEVHVRGIYERIKTKKSLSFSDLIEGSTRPAIVVVTFLAVLELYKRGMLDAKQVGPLGDIELSYIEGSPALILDGDDVFDSDMPESGVAGEAQVDEAQVDEAQPDEHQPDEVQPGEARVVEAQVDEAQVEDDEVDEAPADDDGQPNGAADSAAASDE